MLLWMRLRWRLWCTWGHTTNAGLQQAPVKRRARVQLLALGFHAFQRVVKNSTAGGPPGSHSHVPTANISCT
jgi:hypothetical protein